MIKVKRIANHHRHYPYCEYCNKYHHPRKRVSRRSLGNTVIHNEVYFAYCGIHLIYPPVLPPPPPWYIRFLSARKENWRRIKWNWKNDKAGFFLCIFAGFGFILLALQAIHLAHCILES